MISNRSSFTFLLTAFSIAVFLTGCGGTVGTGGNSGNTGGSGSSSPPSKSNEWTWMSGSNTAYAVGVYGSLGVASTNNVPGARNGSVTWTDSSGNLWLFGGGGASGDLNDLWKFSPTAKTWTWMSGSDAASQAGVYGTKGVVASINFPGARDSASSWKDSSGNFWLFGGLGMDSNGNYGNLNDLWKYSPTNNTWVWVSGSSTVNAAGAYGTQNEGTAQTGPGARSNAVSWTDSSGNFWLFGGTDLNAAYYNDLWEFVPSTNTWTWISGSSTPEAMGIYGSKGIASAVNVPGSRYGAVGWADSGGNLWLFGGSAVSGGLFRELNDLWKFNIATKEWTWIDGSNTPGSVNIGVYGTEGVAASGNIPGSRTLGVSWVDSDGDFWLFGGQGHDAITEPVTLNDLWKFSPSTGEWTWMSGSSATPPGTGPIAPVGVYGTLGVAAASNVPGGRASAVSWTDGSGNLWLFGGDFYNDLWKY